MSAFVVYTCLFFFKQRTAYDLRISDWSSDVCSSDLGTTVTLFLPRHAGSTSAQPRVVSLPAPPPRVQQPQSQHAQTVLVVEDEPRVRASTMAALQELGYNVVEADSGAVALDRLAEDP